LERYCSAYGSGPGFTGNQERICDGLGGDREDEHDGAEPLEDDEPSLGSYDRVFNQIVSWEVSRSSQFDAELDNCDRESDEPLLTECA
jgi:hypothetical protein